MRHEKRIIKQNYNQLDMNDKQDLTKRRNLADDAVGLRAAFEISFADLN